MLLSPIMSLAGRSATHLLARSALMLELLAGPIILKRRVDSMIQPENF